MKQKRQALVRIFLVLGILILLNIVGVRIFGRFDMTEEKMYTLSDASKTLVKNLDDKFLVKAYFTGDLPSPYNNNKRYLQDQLDDYRAYGGQNFQYEFIDPSGKDDVEKEAQSYGIPPVQVQVVKEDKMQVEKAYMGLVFLFGDKKETIPVLQGTTNMEYEISSVIKKMTSKELKRVGFLAGHGEIGLDKIARLKQMLDKQYTVTTVNINDGRPIPPDIAVLVIAGPEQPFKSWEKFLIDQYIMKGGKVAFWLNKVKADLQSQMGQPLNLDMDDMLEAYGARINTDLVRDVRCVPVTVQQQMGFFTIQNQIPFPMIPMASEFNKTSPIVKNMGTVIFFFASSVDTSLAKGKGLQVESLVMTSDQSGRQEGMFMINPNEPMVKENFAEKHIPLAVTLQGAFTSAFNGKQVQTDSTTPSSFGASSPSGTSVDTKIAVIGDGDFIQDQYSGGNKDNLIFATNLIDWLADDIGLAAIRSRETGAKPLDEVSEGTKNLVKYGNLLVPPILVILIGVGRWRWRVAMRKRLESQNF
ncbi:MAG: hypothetical protein EPO24_13930 [Bacteroidetes bacterium]|nr:MAG: hypothetical protein EPO24_13930 [Bacteroidota bacterium]